MKKQLLGLAGALVLLTGCGQATVESVEKDFNSLTEEQKLELMQGSIGEFVGEQLQKAFEEGFEVVEEPVAEIEIEEPKVEVALGTPYAVTENGFDYLNVNIISSTVTRDRNQFHEQACETVVIIKMEVENTGEEQFTAWADELVRLYDSTGYIVDTYPVSGEFSDYAPDLNPGRKATMEVAFGIPEGTEYEVEIIGDVATGKPLDSLFFNGSEQIVQE